MERDPELADSFEAYVESVCEEREKEYHSDLQPFSAEKERIRREIDKTVREFEKSFSEGLIYLLEELKNDPERSQEVFFDAEKCAIFEDKEKLAAALDEGKFLYELLGFKEDTLTKFYQTAYRLLDAKEYQKAKEVFYFLTILAPQAPLFWHSLGYCLSNLERYEEALEAFQNARALDPAEVDSYTGALFAASKLHDIDSYKSICESGLEVAASHPNEEWSRTLHDTLTEAKSVQAIH